MIAVFMLLGYLVGSADSWQDWFEQPTPVFLKTESDIEGMEFQQVGWQQLLGEQDKQLFAELRKQQEILQQQALQQTQITEKMESDLLMSALKANTWHALDGYQINQKFADAEVRIPGFIVPLETDEQRVYSFFIVPYFGACLHYPPPPPNQIIYAELPQGMDLTSIEVPFLFFGKLTSELFEDPVGTAAWNLDVVKIVEFQGDADSTRLHQ